MKMANTAFYIGMIGGGLLLIFSMLWGPIYSTPIVYGVSDTEFYYVFVILPAPLAMLGGLIINVVRRMGIILLVVAGIGNIIGYMFNPVSVFGVLYLYGGYSAARLEGRRKRRR